MTIITGKIKRAVYFGCLGRKGHFMHDHNGGMIYDLKADPNTGFPWGNDILDSGLLKNGKHEDRYDGKVFWTCGGKIFWYAFYWWDNSVDHRGGSNSGIYVCGFGWNKDLSLRNEAWEYGKKMFPGVISRQKYPLVLV